MAPKAKANDLLPQKANDTLPQGSLPDPPAELLKADETAKAGGKRGGVVEEPAVPVKKPRVEEPTAARTLDVPPPKPQLPSPTSDDYSINMGNVMKEIIPYVMHHLRIALASGTQFADMPVHLHQPLDIKTKSETSELVSYKEPWHTDRAVIALTTTAMYEASGSLIWCNPFTSSEDEEVLAGDAVLWSQVREVADGHFRVAVNTIKEL
eukprot:5713668-Heterocapsa_arctica.AAC.1